MFHWDRGLFINRPRLAIDVQRGQPHGFVSHAHADHMGPHQKVYCTPATAALYRERIAGRRTMVELSFGQPCAWGDLQLTTFPAGHCLGSAMLLVEGLRHQGREQSLLYTGDFKLSGSATAQPAELPRADVLIMESTFGRPKYCLPPREEVVAQLQALVREILTAGATPVIHAYALGKAQDATRLLTAAGIPVLQHPEVFAISQVYERCGISLGDVAIFDANRLSGRAVVTLPKRSPRFRLAGIPRPVSIALTGWAIDPATCNRWQVDHALPLSDHADYRELLETPGRVGASRVYCTHGPREFVEDLRLEGIDAHELR
jgi:Cft2 family RNA processing exonuclease